jgi:hypothetical protein
MRFIKLSTSLHTKMAAEKNLEDGQLVRVMEKGEQIPKWRGRTGIPVASKEDEQPQKAQKYIKYNSNNY